MKVFDFDNTLYRGESSLDFYFFMVRDDYHGLRCLPVILWNTVKYKLCIVKRERLEKTINNCLIDLILSSPYTRAVQTAAIISRETGAEIIIETDLHEWVADTGYKYVDDDTAKKRYKKYTENKGIYPDGKQKKWEGRETLMQRMNSVLAKYTECSKVAVVCHGTIIEAVSGTRLKTGGVTEYLFSRPENKKR